MKLILSCSAESLSTFSPASSQQAHFVPTKAAANIILMPLFSHLESRPAVQAVQGLPGPSKLPRGVKPRLAREHFTLLLEQYISTSDGFIAQPFQQSFLGASSLEMDISC